MSSRKYIKNYLAKKEKERKSKMGITLEDLLQQLKPIASLQERIKINNKLKELKKVKEQKCK